MFNDDIKKLCDEIAGRTPAKSTAPDVVEKVAEAPLSARSSNLVGEIDQILRDEEISSSARDGKIAIAKLLAAGDILARGIS
jgi:hypothetical protein